MAMNEGCLYFKNYDILLTVEFKFWTYSVLSLNYPVYLYYASLCKIDMMWIEFTSLFALIRKLAILQISQLYCLTRNTTSLSSVTTYVCKTFGLLIKVNTMHWEYQSCSNSGSVKKDWITLDYRS